MDRGSRRSSIISPSLKPLEWCQMAHRSMEELSKSIRYMELFRTSLDLIHT